ncbi:hypothetical protein [Georgenia yuyongxinii]
MESVTGVVLSALGLFALYWVVRGAVKDGLLDAARERETHDAPEPPHDAVA